ncbi:MAG: MMPL family transporter [Acidobacteriota bacterium]
MTGLLRRLLRRRRSVLALLGLLAIVLLPGLLRLESDNSPKIFFISGSSALETYREMTDLFGSDASLRLVVEGADLWTPDGLRWLGEVEEEAAAVDGVERASGLAGHYRRVGWPPRDVEAFRGAAASNPLDRGTGWIGADWAVATVLVQIAADLEPKALDDVLAALTELARPPAGLALETTVVGLPALNQALDRSAREIDRVFFPLLALFTVLILWVTVRDLGDLVPPLLFVGLSQLLVLGPMGYAGVRLNLVLAILPPVLFVIALATALHLVLRFRQLAQKDRGRPARIIATYREKGWSVLWTGITTAVGFASLAISPVVPVRSLGLWAAAGLLLLTVTAFCVLPPLLALFAARQPHPREPAADGNAFEHRVGTWGRAWGRWAAHHRRLVLGAAVLLGVVALAGLPQIRIESNALRYLDTAHPLRLGIERLETAEIGAAAVEVLVRMRPDDDSAPLFRSAFEVDRLADLAADLEHEPGVYGAVSAGTLLRDAARLVPTTPVNATMRLQMVLAGLEDDVQGREALAAFLGPDRQVARVTAFVETTGSERLEEILARVRDAAERRFPEATIELTGEYPLLLEAQRHLISTLALSLALTLGVIAVVLRLLLPSTRLALLALAPNLWPVLGVLGVMGWADLPLDIATVMVASVVLGLAVDDTVHTLGHFRKLAPDCGAYEAVSRTLGATAPAYLLTGVILSAGFGVCALSDFAPIAHFGSLAAIGIGLAVVGDLFLLPALLSLTPDTAVERLGR